MSKILYDDILNQKFRSKGFLKLRLFDDKVIKQLSEVYNNFKVQHELAATVPMFHATQDSKDPAMAKEVDCAIKEILTPYVEKHLVDYKFLIGAFLIKEVGANSVHHLHQDWNFTDESRYFSFNIWVPLVSTNRQNGCLRFLPGSHKVIPTIRPNYEFPFAFKEVEPMIEDFLEDVPTELGECILLDHSVLHSSWPNLSGNARVVAILTVVPKDAEIMHYYSDDGRHVEQYKIHIDDIYYMSRGSRPAKGILISKFEYNFPQVTKEQFAHWLAERMPQNTVLKNPYQNAFLQQNGFCLLSLFNDGQIQKLKQLFTETISHKDISGFYANHNTGAVDQSIFISEEIRKIVYDTLLNTFPDFDFYVSHYVVKASETVNEFSLHQDWNIVEEYEHKSFQIWIPLSAVDKMNGGLFILPGSHRYFRNYRSGSYSIPIVPADAKLREHIVDLTVPVGSAVVFQNNLFHGSYPNLSSEQRVGIIISIIQKGAKSYLFHKNEIRQRTELYPMDSKTLLSNLHILEKGIIPEGMTKEHDEALCNIDNTKINAETLNTKIEFGLSMKAKSAYRIIKEDAVLNELSENGYCILPFLKATEINDLKKYYEENISGFSVSGRYTSLENSTPEERKKIAFYLQSVIKTQMNRIFIDYKVPIIQYFVKQRKTTGGIDYHTDSTLLLNQAIEQNFAMWIPLMDVDENNGTMVVVPGSHKWYNGVVSGSWPFFPFTEKLKALGKALKINEGSLLLFDTRLIHSSTFNNSDVDRISIVGRIVHKVSQLYSFRTNELSASCISVYEENDDFYYQENRKYFGAGSFNGRYVGDISELPLSEKCIQELDAATDN